MSTINPETRRRLEALKELKAQYYVGSQDAYKFLKARRAHEEFINRVCQGTPWARPTVREISLFINTAAQLVESVMRLLRLRLSNTQNFSIAARPFVNTRFFDGNFSGADVLPSKEISGYTYWAMDFLLLTRSYLGASHATGLTRPLSRMQAFNSFLKANMDLPFLVFEETGERVSMADFVKDTRFRQGNENDFLSFDVRYWFNRECSDDNEATLVERLKVAYDAEDIEDCHKVAVLLQWDMDWFFFKRSVRSRPSDDLMPEEYEFLLAGGKLFNRAENEYTLHTYEMERRIALCTAYCFFDQLSRGAETMIENTLSQLLESRDKMLMLRKRFRELNAPAVILANQEKLCRQRCYEYLAVRKNKRWLIEFFLR